MELNHACRSIYRLAYSTLHLFKTRSLYHLAVLLYHLVGTCVTTMTDGPSWRNCKAGSVQPEYLNLCVRI